MKTNLLLAALLLMPLSAGAEECDKSIVLTSNPPQYKCKDQPEPDKVTFDSIGRSVAGCKDKSQPETHKLSEVPEEKEPSEPMYIGDSVTYVKQPESEKWRKECESDIYDAENSKYDKPLKEQTRWHKAQTKCTMYQAVLLEEIRKDLNED